MGAGNALHTDDADAMRRAAMLAAAAERLHQLFADDRAALMQRLFK